MAIFYSGQAAQRFNCSFEILGQQIKIFSNNQEAPEFAEVCWKISELRFDYVTETELHIRKIDLAEQKLVLNTSSEILLAQKFVKKKPPRYTPTRMAGLIAITIAIIALAWYLANPISQIIAQQIPMRYEAKLVPKILEHFKDSKCYTPEGELALQKIYNRLVEKYPLDHELKIIVVRDSQINAFALLGGVIIVNSGLLEFAVSAEEVAGVIGHEIQHHVQRHITAGIIRATILTAAWQALVGDYSGILVVDPTTMYQVAMLKFSREAESSADRGGVEMLRLARISPQGLANFMERLNAKYRIDKLPEFLLTHPSESRMKWLDKLSTDTTIDLLTPREWQALKMICAK